MRSRIAPLHIVVAKQLPLLACRWRVLKAALPPLGIGRAPKRKSDALPSFKIHFGSQSTRRIIAPPVLGPFS